MMRRRTMISVMISMLMLVSFIFGASSAFASTLDDIKWQIDNAGSKKEDLAGQLSDVNNQLSAKQEELEKTSNEYVALIKEKEAQMSDLEKSIAELEVIFDEIVALQQTIEEAEQEYEEALDLFYKRTSVIYKYTSFSQIQLLTESKNIFDYNDRVNLLTNILNSDKAMMEELVIMKNDLDMKKQAVEITGIDINKAIQEKQAVIEKIQNSQEILESDLIASRSAIEKLEQQEEALLAETNRISANIASLQAQYDTLLAQQNIKYDDTTKLLWPSQDTHRISSYYGYRIHPIQGIWKFHSGIDISASGGTNILAAKEGTVMTSTYSSSYGYYIVIYHGDGVSTLYAHASRLLVNVGDTVSRGQVIALVGSTGWSTGNHLHFEVRVNGETKNPLDYLP